MNFIKKGLIAGLAVMGIAQSAVAAETMNASYCVNSDNIKPISDYATTDADDPMGELKFYDEGGTPIVSTHIPDVSMPGLHRYYVSQVNSTTGEEGPKQPIDIKVYGVGDVMLSEAMSKYCRDAMTTPLEEIVISNSSTDPYIIDEANGAEWEFFKSVEPVANKRTLGAQSSMRVSSSNAGVVFYYARLKYELPNSTEVCYGKHEEYTVEVVAATTPIVNSAITYLKDDADGGIYRKPTDQDPSAIVLDASCITCNLHWYSEKDPSKEITESEAIPVYDPALIGTKVNRFYVRQSMEVSSDLLCASEFVPIDIQVVSIPAPRVNDVEVCEGSPMLSGTLMAVPSSTPDMPADDFELVWYSNKPDGSIDEAAEYLEIILDPEIQRADAYGESIKVYTYYVRQRLKNPWGIQSAAVPVRVSVHPAPRLKVLEAEPKCYGEAVDLRDMVDVSLVGASIEYYDEVTLTPLSSPIVTEPGQYTVKAYHEISSTRETCVSKRAELDVTFHKLDASIIGSDVTCAGESVDLEVDLKLEGVVDGEVRYSWKNDKNSEVSTSYRYNTGTDGLENAGDKMTVSLEVSTSACKKIVTMPIKAANGPISGTIAFSEKNNDMSGINQMLRNNMTFSSCGGDVDVELTGVENTEGTYTLSGDAMSVGDFDKSGNAKFQLAPGKYTLTYVNNCPTSFDFEIVDNGIDAISRNYAMTICEGEPWLAEVEVEVKNGIDPLIEWQKDGMAISGETDTKLKLEAAKPSDSGVYSYTIRYAGCRFDGYIADGTPLTVVMNSDDVRNIVADPNELVNVYNSNGILVKKQVEYRNALVGLQPGVYMVNGVKMIVK